MTWNNQHHGDVEDGTRHPCGECGRNIVLKTFQNSSTPVWRHEEEYLDGERYAGTFPDSEKTAHRAQPVRCMHCAKVVVFDRQRKAWTHRQNTSCQREVGPMVLHYVFPDAHLVRRFNTKTGRYGRITSV